MEQESFEIEESVGYKLNDFNRFYWYPIIENDDKDESKESVEVYQTYIKIFKNLCQKRKIEYVNNVEKLFLIFMRELQENSMLDVSLLLDLEKIKNYVFSNANDMQMEEIYKLEEYLKDIFDTIGFKLRDIINKKHIVSVAFKGLEEIKKETIFENNNAGEVLNENDEWEFEVNNDWGKYSADELLDDDLLSTYHHEELLPATDDDIKEIMEFLLILPQITKMYDNIKKVREELADYKNQRELKEYMKDTEFISNLEKLMQHDSGLEEYRYHGTQSLVDGQSILEKGLLMASSDLDKTSYSEISIDQLLLYKRGINGEIGKDCMVIFSIPKGKNVVEPINSGDYSFAQSGLGGFDYGPKFMVPSEYIVGYVDKANHIIIKNPNYSKNIAHTL